MGVMTLYHGSKGVIERPVFGAGRTYNDYGRAFYCTEHEDMAMEWAVDAGRDGYANCYELGMDGLAVVDLNAPGFTILHWLAVLLENRVFDIHAELPREAREYLIANFKTGYEHADVVRGYRADDSYFRFAQDFLNGTIPLRKLAQAMKLGDLGEQVAIKSERAFGRLAFKQARFASHEEWYPLRRSRDEAARGAYYGLREGKRQRGDLYIVQILDEEMKANDPRLQ